MLHLGPAHHGSRTAGFERMIMELYDNLDTHRYVPLIQERDPQTNDNLTLAERCTHCGHVVDKTGNLHILRSKMLKWMAEHQTKMN